MKKIKIYAEDGVTLPAYQTDGSAGMDLQANNEQPILIEAGNRAVVGTGLYMEIPEGYEGQIRPRSGLTLKHGVTVLNAPGTIDADYRGEIRVILYNASDRQFFVNKGDRIAQMVFARVERATFALTTLEKLTDTKRGAGGFGSTGR